MKRILTFLVCVLIFILGACANMKGNSELGKSLEKSSREITFTQAKNLVERMARLTDQRAWFDLEQVFASRTVYNFGTPEILTPTQIVDRLKPVLSFFKQTNQDISNFQFRETQGRMLGTANFTLYHEKDTSSDVTLRGQYEMEFVRNQDNELRIMRITMIPGSIIGMEKLLEDARKVSPTEKFSYTTEPVSFQSKENKLVGWLLKPLEPKSRDVIVVAGPLASVKEQVAYPYAKKFVEKGFPVLVFDFSGFGESEGKIRNQEIPLVKTSDLLAAVNYLTNRTEYEHSKINFVGFDASAGYVAHEASADPRISRLALVVPNVGDQILRQQQLGEEYNRQIAMSEKASETYLEKDSVTYIPLVSLTDKIAFYFSKNSQSMDFYLNPDRGNIPQWENKLAALSVKPWLTFDAISAAPQIRVPILIIDSSELIEDAGVTKFISKLRIKSEFKELQGSHEDFYDRPELMAQVVNTTVDFFNKEIPVEPLRQAQEE